jgi:4-amino-4-deoxy-L-arabinose transferase-like glycosyltransferase
MAAVRNRLLLVLLLAVSAVGLFASLDDRYLWDDEAENALLARSVLVHGLPIARDGAHVISQICGRDADDNYLWSLFPWLPIYLTAGAFKVLGVSTFAARLPFALAGVLAVLSVYRLGMRLFAHRGIALLAATFLAASVPFLLHARQSRYYALAIVAGAWMVYAFVALVEDRRWALLGLIGASTLMFHSNHPIFVATFAALVVAFVVVDFDRRALGRVALAALAIVLVNAPWLVIYRAGWTAAARPADAVGLAVQVFTGYVKKIDHAVFPALLLVLFLLWLLIEGRRAVWASPGFRRAIFLVVFVVVYVALLSLRPGLWTRYVVNLFPALALLQAYVVCAVGARRPVLAGVAALLLVATDGLHGWLSVGAAGGGGWPVRSPLLGYAMEVRSSFTGPMKAIARHLRESARPGDRVYITYGDLPLRFHTDLDVRGGLGCESPVVVPPPEWVIVRFFIRTVDGHPLLVDDARRQLDYLRELPWPLYRRVDLPVVDTVWENMPELSRHHFVTPAAGPLVTIHERVRPPAR